MRSKSRKNLQRDDSNVSVHSDDSNVDNTSILSEQPSTPTSENGRVRPTRPAPSIPTGLSRSGTRRSAPPPPIRLVSKELATGRLARQSSVEDNASYAVRKMSFLMSMSLTAPGGELHDCYCPFLLVSLTNFCRQSNYFDLPLISVRFFLQGDDVDHSESSSGSSNHRSNASATPSSSQSRQSSLDSPANRQPPAAATVSDADLPSGWSMQLAPNGRVFFINHAEKTTSWVDPRTGSASPMPNAQNTVEVEKQEDDLGPLPEGWEERIHSDSRIFFIDHNTRTVRN